MIYTVNELDKFDVVVLQHLKLDNFMPIMIKTDCNDTIIQYQHVDNYIAVSQLTHLSEQVVITILSQLVTIIENMRRYILCENKLNISLDYIFINGNNVKWCYCPEIQMPNKLDISPLLNKLLFCQTLKLESVLLLPLYQWVNRPVFCEELSLFLKQQNLIEKNNLDEKIIMPHRMNTNEMCQKNDTVIDGQINTQHSEKIKPNILSVNESWLKRIWTKIVLFFTRQFTRQHNVNDMPNQTHFHIFEDTVLLTPHIHHVKNGVLIDVETKKEIVLSNDKDIIIGSFLHNPFDCVKAQGISRRHIKIIATPQGYVLSDLNSKNGTFVNGHKLEKQGLIQLTHGDNITIGNKTFQFLVK